MPQLQIKLSDGTELVQKLTGITTIGRHPDNLLVLDEGSVSGHHAKIDAGNSGIFVTDLFSSNGTYVNGEKIMTQKLEEGDQVPPWKSGMRIFEFRGVVIPTTLEFRHG